MSTESSDFGARRTKIGERRRCRENIGDLNHHDYFH